MDPTDRGEPAGGDGFASPGDLPAAALAAVVPRLSQTSVLVVGDAMLDRYVYGRVERLSREAPVPVLAVQRQVSLPGGAGNVVHSLGGLGVAVAFVSLVGDDQAGSDLTGLIGGRPGVEPWLLVQSGRVTTVKSRFIAGDGRQSQQLLRADCEEASPVSEKLADRVVRIARDAMAVTALVVLADFGKGLLAGDMPARLLAAARQAGRQVLVDLHGADCARYAGADLILPDMAAIVPPAEPDAEDEPGLTAAARALRQQHGFGAVIAHRGGGGITVVDGSGERHFRAALHPFDADRVRDTIVAVLAAGLAAGFVLPLAARLAAAAANVAAGRTGHAAVAAADLLAAVRAAG
jgi:D-beta-D-heptose 7-phosphate kinase/D-beta-D-heptose 1-phosphate adenosyltransferase